MTNVDLDATRADEPGKRVTAPPVRPGHWDGVTAMGKPEFAAIVDLFEGDPRIGGTYFRIVENGFQPLDLDQLADKPLIGVGATFPAATTAEQLRTGFEDRVGILLTKRSTSSRSVEKRLEAHMIRSALRAGLEMAGLPNSLRFIASQWRIDLGGKAAVLDVVAADVETGGLVVIELKTKPDTKAKVQAATYVKHLQAHVNEYVPFFSAMGSAMAKLYSCSDMPELRADVPVAGIAAWPVEPGYFKIVHC